MKHWRQEDAISKTISLCGRSYLWPMYNTGNAKDEYFQMGSVWDRAVWLAVLRQPESVLVNTGVP